MDDDLYEMSTLETLADLIAHGKSVGYGIIFEPEDEGWRVSWIRSGQGGPLAQGASLHTTAEAAFSALTGVAATRSSS